MTAVGPSPAVSVCVPTYNAAPFVAATVESVLAQTYTDFELIVVDDASTDDTAGLVGGYADRRIRLLRNGHSLGLAGNWNRAVGEARGRYVKLLCQDDLLRPDCLAVQAGVLDDPAQAGVALVCARRDIIDEAGKVLIPGRGMRRAGRVPAAEALRRIVRAGTNAIGEPVAVLFRAGAFARAGGFDGASPYMIDLDLWARLLRYGDLYAVRQTLAAFRVSRAALSTVIAASQARETRNLLRRLRDESPGMISRADLLIGMAKATALAHARRLAYAWLWGRRPARKRIRQQGAQLPAPLR